MPPIINDEGVSEIIAVLLIAVVTILLAVILASLSYDFARDLKQQNYVAVSVNRIDSTTISISNAGGDVQILDTAVACPFIIRVNGVTVTALSGNLDKTVGSLSRYDANFGSHVVVTALCNDGSAKVIYDDTL